MTIEEVKNTLPHKNGDIFMDLYINYISDEDFVDKFGESELTYDSLMKNTSATPGWKNQFSAWKEKGILN